MAKDVIRLQSGGNVGLTSNNPFLKELIVGFGWELIPSNGPQTELVPSAIMLDANGNALSPEHFVFFNQLSTPDDAVRYVTKSDKEQLEVDLSLIPKEVAKIVFIVYADPDLRKPGNFGSVRSSYMRVADREDQDIATYDLEPVSNDVTALIFGEIYRYNGAWKFRAVGQGYTTGLNGVIETYGLKS